jgi:Na+/glutamate symporter
VPATTPSGAPPDGETAYAARMQRLRRMPMPARVVAGLVVLALLWHLVGSLSWIVDIGFAIWVMFIVELIFWYSRRRANTGP